MSGVGFGTLDASINTWMGNLVDSNQLLGIVHGCYGIGSLISPSLISYLLSKSNHPWKWQNYYVILSVVAGFCLVSLILTFKYETPKSTSIFRNFVINSKRNKDKHEKMVVLN